MFTRHKQFRITEFKYFKSKHLRRHKEIKTQNIYKQKQKGNTPLANAYSSSDELGATRLYEPVHRPDRVEELVVSVSLALVF
jgi:hypothetical protein